MIQKGEGIDKQMKESSTGHNHWSKDQGSTTGNARGRTRGGDERWTLEQVAHCVPTHLHRQNDCPTLNVKTARCAAQHKRDGSRPLRAGPQWFYWRAASSYWSNADTKDGAFFLPIGRANTALFLPVSVPQRQAFRFLRNIKESSGFLRYYYISPDFVAPPATHEISRASEMSWQMLHQFIGIIFNSFLAIHSYQFLEETRCSFNGILLRFFRNSSIITSGNATVSSGKQHRNNQYNLISWILQQLLNTYRCNRPRLCQSLRISIRPTGSNLIIPSMNLELIFQFVIGVLYRRW